MAFSDQSYHKRMNSYDEEPAELWFKKYADQQGWYYGRYGFQKCPLHTYEVDVFIRSAPDFMAQIYREVKGRTYVDETFFVECKGIGKEKVLKLKQNVLPHLLPWKEYHPIKFFVYDIVNHRAAVVHYDEMKELADAARLVPFKNETHKFYHEIPSSILTWQALPPKEKEVTHERTRSTT